MNNLKNILLLLTVVTLFSSCQDVIELELENVAPRLVVEANISDQVGPYTVNLSETGDFYKKNTFPPRTGATVIIFDDSGNRETLTEVAPGIYETSSIQGVRGSTYTIEISSEGKNYIASSKIPDQILPIDTIISEFLEESFFQDEGYFVTLFAQDIPLVKNYYRYKVFVNGKVYVFYQDEEDEDEVKDDNIYLDQDKFHDGLIFETTFPQKLSPGDSVTIEMYHINKGSFDYYRSLLDAIGAAGVAPSNPISNFGKLALGNFNAYTFDSKTIRVEQ
jgi:hypothetical protein